MREIEATFAFVDLAGFSALTEAHGDRDAADLIDRFEALAREALVEGGRFVKSIGDAVFLTFDDPPSALKAIERLTKSCAAEPGFPLPRSGLHHGAAVVRGEDLTGGAVNLAARVAGQAHGAQVLATEAVAAVAKRSGVHVVELGSFDLRNIRAPVTLYQLDLYPDAAGSAVDPVCRMAVARTDSAGRLRHLDVDYWFCSLECASRFAADPAGFAL